jgi:ABC-type polysaccharide/polyol phosphate export permease
MIQHLSAIWKFRHFLLALVRLDLRLRYRRSLLGVGWSLLNPLAMTTVFAVVFTHLFGGNDPNRYIPYLLIGMAVWGFLREGTVQGCRALIGNESYIRQSPLPYGLYTLRTVLGQAIHSGIAFGIGLVVTVGCQRNLRVFEILWAVLPGLVLAFVAVWAVATIFAFINVYFQDTQHLLEVGAQIVFYLTPIMYPREVLDRGGIGWVADLNPANLFLELIRTPLVTGELPAADLYLTVLGLTAVAVGLAVGTAAWLQKRVIFHL